jgi:IS5 family transposase
MAFFDYALTQMIEPGNLLVKIESILDWQPISDMLDKKLGKRDISIAGKIPYNSLSMFKTLLIQQWHTLSDPKIEVALRTRIDFMWFTGFGLATNEFVVPDETTICRFRNKLIKTKLLGKLLSMVNKQLERHKLKVRISEGAVLDATLIEAAVNSRAKPRVIVEDRKENDGDDDNTANPSNIASAEVNSLSANDQSNIEIDKDAKWLKKGKKNIFGYKGFITTDTTDGYIESIQVTAANVSEVTNLEPALSGVTKMGIKVLYTDKGYASASNVEWLESNGIGNGIMDKAKRNTPLTKKQMYRNKRISKTRYIVERTNATVKNIFKFGKSRYVGISRVTGQAILVAVAHNLLKAANKIDINMTFYRKVVSKNCLNGLFA